MDEYLKAYADELGNHKLVEAVDLNPTTPPWEDEPVAVNDTMVLNKHHGNIPDDAIYIGRGSGWGNEWSHLPNTTAKYKVATREEAVAEFEKDLERRIQSEGINLINALASLHGKKLVCFCAPKACHGDVLVKKALWAFEFQQRTKHVEIQEPVIQEPAPAIITMPQIAIIGTAGRDKDRIYNLALWQWMVTDCWNRLPKECTGVSGGAAWADHLAVALFCMGRLKGLRLHLPAPFDMDRCRFVGEYGSAGGTANYYHEKFSRVMRENTLAHIAMAIQGGASWTYQPAQQGFGPFKARNTLVARDCTGMLAYTFGEGDVPADGGTRDTWDKFHGEKIHVALPR